MKLNETTTPHNREMLERLDYHTDMDPELFVDCADIDYHIWLLANGSIEALEKYGVSAGDFLSIGTSKKETPYLWNNPREAVSRAPKIEKVETDDVPWVPQSWRRLE